MCLRTRAFRVVKNCGLGPTGVPQGGNKWGNVVKLKQIPPESKAITTIIIVSLIYNFQYLCCLNWGH